MWEGTTAKAAAQNLTTTLTSIGVSAHFISKTFDHFAAFSAMLKWDDSSWGCAFP
jgi:hypothetical protein